MNELNAATHDLEHPQDIASVDLGRLLASSLPRIRLLPLVAEKVKLAMVQFVERAHVSASAGDVMGSTKVVDYLRQAQAIPLQAELCTLMARVGFDKALFTYGHAAGTPVGYAEGMWLLKFVEPTDKAPSMDQQPSWLKLLGKSATRH